MLMQCMSWRLVISAQRIVDQLEQFYVVSLQLLTDPYQSFKLRKPGGALTKGESYSDKRELRE